MATPLNAAIARADTLEPFDAFDTLWTALLRAANERQEKTEHQRVLGLVKQLPEAALINVTSSDAIKRLMSLDPPLETEQANPHEDLAPEKTATAFAIITAHATKTPEVAIEALGEVLKRIRNKRAHGFKSDDPATRDGQILQLAAAILRQLCSELARLSN